MKSVSIDVKVSVRDPKMARSYAYLKGLAAFDPGPGDTVKLTYLSEGRVYFGDWVFDATVEWTPLQ